MTFPGESIVLDWANPIAGSLTDWGDPIRYRDGSDTLVAGTSFIAGFYNYRVVDDYPGEPVEASVVLVLGAATSGTVRVSYGVDPDFDLTNTALATQDLGAHAVSGASELVLPVSLDLPGLLAYDHEQIAYVEILSGVVEVTQIKFRLWPPDGISGAWVLGPVGTIEASHQALAARPPTSAQGHATTSMSDAYTDAEAEWAAFGDMAVSGRSATVGGRVHHIDDAGGPSFDEYSVFLDIGVLHVEANNVGETILTSAAGQIAHPDEVWGEPGAVVRDAAGDPVVYEFGSWNGDIEVAQWASSRDGDPIPSANPQRLSLTSAPRPATYASGGTTYTAKPGGPVGGLILTPPTTTNALNPEVSSVTLPASPEVLVTVSSYSWYAQDLEHAYVDEFGSVIYTSEMSVQVTIPADLTATLLIPTHYVWDPGAVEAVEIPMRIRQRGDGLGMGAPRVRGTASRQRSTRVRGHY